MTLTQNEQNRIYEEEKAHDAARKQIKQEENRRKNKKILYWFLGIFVFFMIIIIISPPKNTPEVQNTNENAHAMANYFVEKSLKAPATAKFAPSSETHITSNKERTIFEVSSYVDSENSFGANIRTNFTVKMRYEPKEDKWYLIDLQTE